MRTAILPLVVCTACIQAAPASRHATVPATSPAPPATSPSPSAPAPAEPPSLASILAMADFQALTLFHDLDFDADTESLVLSAQLDDGSGASCIKQTAELRCVEFAGYTPHHLVAALRKGDRPAIATPAWAERVARMAEAKEVSDVEIDVFLGEGGPVLMIRELDGVVFAVRRDRRWRVSTVPKSGGKSITPAYFGSVDLSRATGGSSIGVIISSYSKESCVRSETVELVVMQIEDDELAELGSVIVGIGEWIYTDGRHAPFDPKDPNHYRIQLRPRVQHDGRVRLEIESRHTPKALAKRRHVCGLELTFGDIDQLTGLIGHHRLGDLYRKDEWDDESLPAPDD